ncbi:MAG: hypothetical protein KGJ43_01320, partial [Acidobacteriota bacterium]|nr:hypothetical protein [Acidobacteriota bacterium]
VIDAKLYDPGMAAGLLSEALVLPCGLELPNRICRAAMTEGLSDSRNDPTARHERLYAAAAQGGPGLLITGNAMVDRRHLERARAVVIDAATSAERLRRWAEACSPAPTLVQLSHPGRQVTRFVQRHPVAASTGPPVTLGIGPSLFRAPRALTVDEIREVTWRFIDAARRVVQAGFAGVEIHAAHGYLLSSFLDGRLNRRSDAYGNGAAGRSRLLLEIVQGLRRELPGGAAIAVKLDAREGGEDDLALLATQLEAAGADLLEVSGGSYESAAMLGLDGDGDELRGDLESPFWAAAERVAAATRVPVVLTGGFRTRAGAERALALGVAAMVGVGRPLAVRPALARAVVLGEADALERPGPRLRGPRWLRRLAGAAAGAGWYRCQLARTGAGRGPSLRLPAWVAAADYVVVDAIWALRHRRARMRMAEAVASPPAPPAPAEGLEGSPPRRARSYPGAPQGSKVLAPRSREEKVAAGS